MTASRVPDTERTEWSYDDLPWELKDLAEDDAEGFELETAARPGFEDEMADDEIERASEELQSDEG